MPVCPKCNALYEDDAKFCKNDGALLIPLRAEIYLPLGAVVNESLRVVERLRTDRFGVVYRVEDTIVPGHCMSLRLCRRGLVSSRVYEAVGELADRIRSLEQEPDIAANYIPIQLEDGRYAILGDDYHGVPLDEIIVREAPLTPPYVVRTLLRIADVLSGAHDLGLYHGNITPENVVVVDRTERALVVKLADFGLASTIRRYNARALSAPEESLPLRNYDNYYAPELVTGRDVEATASTDIFAIGALCYHMLSGWVPFSEAAIEGDRAAVYLTDDPRPLNVLNKELGVPPALEQIMLRALERDPARRPASLAEVVEALQEIELDLSILPSPHEPPSGKKKSRGKRGQTKTGPTSPRSTRESGGPAPETGEITPGKRARDTG